MNDMNGEQKFTKGPWSVHSRTNCPDDDPELSRHLGIHADGDEGRGGSYVAVIEGDMFEADEEMANAQLIASAPDLLAALENFVSVGCEFYDMDMGENGCDAIEQARAAIAKALGRSEG